MNSQEILHHLETFLMEDIGYHLAVPSGRLEHYHLAAQIRDVDVISQQRYADHLSELYQLILNMKPFCMEPPPGERMVFDGADVAQGDLVRVTKMHNILRGCTEIHVDFIGRVFNEP